MLYQIKDIYTIKELRTFITNRIIIYKKVLRIRGEDIKILPMIDSVDGGLILDDTIIKSLGSLKYIKGDFKIQQYANHSNLDSLGNLQQVGGNLSLMNSSIKNLGKLRYVGGNLNLQNIYLENLGELKYVGGVMTLPKRLKGKIDTSKVKVKKYIRYLADDDSIFMPPTKTELNLTNSVMNIPKWDILYLPDGFSIPKTIKDMSEDQRNFYDYFKSNLLKKQYIDLESNNSYIRLFLSEIIDLYKINKDDEWFINILKELQIQYPILRRRVQGEFKNMHILKKDYEKIWDEIKHGPTTVYLFEHLWNKRLLNSDLIVQWAGTECLTGFGKENLEKIKILIIPFLEDYEIKKGIKFFDLFFGKGYLYKAIDNAPLKDIPLIDFINGEYKEDFSYYDSHYYSQFYDNENEFKICLDSDNYLFNIQLPKVTTSVVSHAIENLCRSILMKCEDKFRESMGLPKVGEGWIGETYLYYSLVVSFPELEIIHHGKPKWLGRQHLDVFIPVLNVGIEYQGSQHFEPIDFFGGHEGFLSRVKLDKRKKSLCEKNNCALYYVEEGYVLNEIIEIIRRHLTITKNENVVSNDSKILT